jgi:DNA mismatch repair protein MutL
MEILGQLRNTYLVCQSNEGLTLIDQHAAHERIAFERLKKDWRNRSIQKQALLFPETLELSIKEAKEMERVLEMMNSLGFEIEPFGERAFITRALPAVLAKADPRAIVLDLLDALSDVGSAYTLEDRLDEVFARISCHAVIRAGKSLSNEEMKALLRSLDEADYPLTCPHGRPICVHITYEELEKMFGRR